MPSGYVKPRPWTADEDARMVEFAGQGLSAPQIAQRIGRTKGSIHSRLTKYYPELRATIRSMWDVTGTKRDERDALRIRVYETALGLTRERLGEAMPDVSAVVIDRILADLLGKWRTCGNWLPPLLSIRSDGVYERHADRDMQRPGPYEPRAGKTANRKSLVRPGRRPREWAA